MGKVIDIADARKDREEVFELSGEARADLLFILQSLQFFIDELDDWKDHYLGRDYED